MTNNGMKYTNKMQILPGVPPRDLTHEEVYLYGGYERLKLSGIYTEIKTKAKKGVKDGNNN